LFCFCFVLIGTIPVHWRRYKVHKVMSVSEWIPDLARRLAQLDNLSSLDNLSNVEIWLGGLFFPEAYVTATRQAVAHRKKWSLETLNLRLDIERVNDPNAFIVDGKPFSRAGRCANLISDPVAHDGNRVVAENRPGAGRCFLDRRPARPERGRVGPLEPVADSVDPGGRVGRRAGEVREPAGVPQQ